MPSYDPDEKEKVKVIQKPIWRHPLYRPSRVVFRLKAEQKIAPNGPCPCGAVDLLGLPVKYKKCHGALVG